MKKKISLAVLGILLAATMPAQARNVKYTLPIADAMNSGGAKEKLDGSVKFYFGLQKAPVTLQMQKMTSVETNGKASIVDHVDIPACNEAFVLALRQLQENAKAAGANAVVNIVSSYPRNPPLSSATEFECHAGSYSVGLILKGDIVKAVDK